MIPDALKCHGILEEAKISCEQSLNKLTSKLFTAKQHQWCIYLVDGFTCAMNVICEHCPPAVVGPVEGAIRLGLKRSLEQFEECADFRPRINLDVAYCTAEVAANSSSSSSTGQGQIMEEVVASEATSVFDAIDEDMNAKAVIISLVSSVVLILLAGLCCFLFLERKDTTKKEVKLRSKVDKGTQTTRSKIRSELSGTSSFSMPVSESSTAEAKVSGATEVPLQSTLVICESAKVNSEVQQGSGFRDKYQLPAKTTVKSLAPTVRSSSLKS